MQKCPNRPPLFDHHQLGFLQLPEPPCGRLELRHLGKLRRSHLLPLFLDQFFRRLFKELPRCPLTHIEVVLDVAVSQHEVLPDNKEDARSMKEIAQAMGLNTSSHASWIREQRTLARVLRILIILRILIKWGWAACDRIQGNGVDKLWHNVNWKVDVFDSAEP